MRFDYHTHCDSSFDSIAPMPDMIQSAIDKGLDAICLTDHLDIDYRFTQLYYSLEPKAYLRRQEEIIARFPEFDVRKGIEVGLQPQLKDTITQLLSDCDFDFIIGSVHYIKGEDPYFPDYFEGMTSQQAYTIYLQELIECLTGYDRYSVVGHICYPSRLKKRSWPMTTFAIFQTSS